MNINEIQPLSKARVEKMSSGEYNRAVTTIIQYIIQIAEEHFAEAGLEFKIDKEPTSYWFLFGLHLHSALISHTRVLSDAKYLAFLRSLSEEIFDFLMFAYDGAPAYQISELARAFGSGISCGPILRLLLPARAQPVMVEADRILEEFYDDERRRQDQMGY